MLKLIYTDENFCLDRLSQSLDNWLNDRAVLALRTSQHFCLESSAASFLVRRDVPLLADLWMLARDCEDILAIAVCDAEYCEVSLEGYWVTTGGDCCGMFICALGDRPELLLENVWLASQASMPVLRD